MTAQWYGRGINIIVFLDLCQVFDGCRDWADQVLPGVSDTPAFSAVCVSPCWLITILFLTLLVVKRGKFYVKNIFHINWDI